MRDGSTAAVFFNVGDRVKIIRDVPVTNDQGLRLSTLGMEGVISEIWEKCEVDPHCCCAEQSFDAPFRVDFATMNSTSTSISFYGLFAEEEIDHCR